MNNQNNSKKAVSSVKDESYASSQVLFTVFFFLHAVALTLITQYVSIK